MYLGRCPAEHRGTTAIMLATNNVVDKAHRDSSTTWPRFDVVSTEYQEHTSAIAMSGRRSREAVSVTMLSVIFPVARSSNAHCAAKHSSAIVATDRPITTLDNQVLITVSRGTSKTGKDERNAQPKT